MQETKLNEGRQTQVFSELTHLQLATTKVHHITNKLICYIEDVLSGKCRGDPQVGRLLTDMISKVPDIPPSQFEHLLNNSMQVCVCVRMHLPVLAFKVFLFGAQDLLMVLYLSNLTRIQLSMGEKLSLLMS
jgi:translation initiation factor 3 subunit F